MARTKEEQNWRQVVREAPYERVIYALTGHELVEMPDYEREVIAGKSNQRLERCLEQN